MSNKWTKRILGLLAAGAFVGGVIAYFMKKNECTECDDDFSDDFEDEDFDLDEDLKDPSERGYVSLTPEAAKEAVSEEAVSEEDAHGESSAEAEE